MHSEPVQTGKTPRCLNFSKHITLIITNLQKHDLLKSRSGNVFVLTSSALKRERKGFSRMFVACGS